MKKLIFATNNAHKLFEIRKLLEGKGFELLGLKESGIHEEIPEDHDTFEENAVQKARHIYRLTGVNCFADDTGLEIEALHGEPGVYSARYSMTGSPVFPDMDVTEGNIRKVLQKMKNIDNRKAQFRTVIALILDNREYSFQGIVKGEIIHEKRGGQGFGYDPVFIPEGYDQTFSEMSVEIKNKISHRAKAMRKLLDFLESV